MSKAELLALAKKLGINAKALVEHVTEHGKSTESVLEEEEELERWRHSKQFPAFSERIAIPFSGRVDSPILRRAGWCVE